MPDQESRRVNPCGFFSRKRIRCKILNVETKTGALVLEKRGGEIIHATSPKQVTLPKRVRVRKGSQD